MQIDDEDDDQRMSAFITLGNLLPDPQLDDAPPPLKKRGRPPKKQRGPGRQSTSLKRQPIRNSNVSASVSTATRKSDRISKRSMDAETAKEVQ